MSPIYFWLDLLGSIPFVSRIITSICYPQSAAFADYTASESVGLFYFVNMETEAVFTTRAAAMPSETYSGKSVCLMFLYSAGYRNREERKFCEERTKT